MSIAPIRLGAMALLAVSLAACEAPRSEPESPPITEIGDTPWRLASVDGEPTDDVDVVLDIEGGFISGRGPCNNINANYLGQPPVFQVETLITTKKACDRLGLENRIVEALVNADRAVVEKERLTISGPDSPLLRFDPA